MSARRSTLALVAAAFVATAAEDVSAQSGPRNFSSHDAAFFTDLLADRVWLYERPSSTQAGDRGLVWGIHHGADGRALACIHLDGAWQTREGRWRVVPSPRFRALYNYREAGTEPDLGHVKGHVPIFYDPESGRLHSESLGAAGSPGGPLSGWFVLSLGWVQESWPQALIDACPGLDLPALLAVNRNQTSAIMEEAVAQDPEAALRVVPGSDLRAPGSTGVALAAGAPTVTAGELRRFLAANDGHVLESPAGVRLVLALGGKRDELWRLDAEGEVVDTAVLLPSADGTGITVQWERLPRRLEYRLGDPFPLRQTGVRYGAHLLMDRLIADGRPVSLPLGDGGEAAVRFAAGGRASAAPEDQVEVEGRWWWSRGNLHLALDGAPGRSPVPGRFPVVGTSAYPWRTLAVLGASLIGVDPGSVGGVSAGE